MSASGAKVITALRERLQIERQIKAMLNARSETEFSSQAERVAALGDQVVPAILGNLEYTDPRMLSALGAVAALYPRRDPLLNKLYEAASDLSRSDRARLSAILILERFLGVDPDPYLVGTLNDPHVMAIESIRAMIDESEREPAVLIEYMATLAAQAPDTFSDIVDTLLEVGQERAVPALCLLAQEDEPLLAQIALETLGRLSYPQAVRGLQSILPMLPPERRAIGERSLRKMQFKGVPVLPRPAMPAAWRALVSPVDGLGSQVIWFIRDPDAQGNCALVGMSLSLERGIGQAYGRHQIPAHLLPARKPVGYVHPVSLEDASQQEKGHERPRLYMLETGLGYARRLVLDGQTINLKDDSALPIEYRLMGQLLWQYDDPEAETSHEVPPSPERQRDMLQRTPGLLEHPAFRGWFTHGEVVVRHAVAMFQWMPHIFQEGMHTWASALVAEYYDQPAIAQLSTRLQAMAEWLRQAGEPGTADLAVVAAETILEVPPVEHPLILRMAELGLQAVMDQAQIQFKSNQQKEN